MHDALAGVAVDEAPELSAGHPMKTGGYMGVGTRRRGRLALQIVQIIKVDNGDSSKVGTVFSAAEAPRALDHVSLSSAGSDVDTTGPVRVQRLAVAEVLDELEREARGVRADAVGLDALRRRLRELGSTRGGRL